MPVSGAFMPVGTSLAADGRIRRRRTSLRFEAHRGAPQAAASLPRNEKMALRCHPRLRRRSAARRAVRRMRGGAPPSFIAWRQRLSLGGQRAARLDEGLGDAKDELRQQRVHGQRRDRVGLGGAPTCVGAEHAPAERDLPPTAQRHIRDAIAQAALLGGAAHWEKRCYWEGSWRALQRRGSSFVEVLTQNRTRSSGGPCLGSEWE